MAPIMSSLTARYERNVSAIFTNIYTSEDVPTIETHPKHRSCNFP